MSSLVDKQVVVIGAGIGGLTSAALLLKSGVPVKVLEAQVYPGGSAGTFFNQGYRFDSGATLAGGFDADGPHQRLLQYLNIDLPVYPADPAWVVHLNNHQIHQWSDRQAWQAERQIHFPHAEPFWRKQEQLAQIAWRLTRTPFPYPPRRLGDLLSLSRQVKPALLPAIPYIFRSVAEIRTHSISPLLKTFLDAQLLISAQTTSPYANAVYGSAALDLPRRGVVMPQGGMGSISTSLVNWIRENGGQVLYRQAVTQLTAQNGGWLITTSKGQQFSASHVIANLTPAGLAEIVSSQPASQRKVSGIKSKPTGWGAFVLYLGIEAESLGSLPALHHQIVVDSEKPLGEGNSVFMSLSHPEDTSRAQPGHLAVTLSTHTRVDPWWHWHTNEPQIYQDKKDEYTEMVLSAAKIALPELGKAIRLQMAGTPITFQSFIRRPRGYVGGYPQTSLLKVRSSHSGLKDVWLVGDSIFPGQSSAAVTIGAMQVAAQVLKQLGHSAND